MDKMINFIQSLPDNQQMDDVTLRMKCIMLFKIVDLSRSADIIAISFKSVSFSNNVLSGTRRPIKNYKKDRPADFQYKAMDNIKLCVVKAWQEYFLRTSHIPRPKDRVFVSHQKIVKEIGTEAIAKDTMKLMQLAQIDTTKFKSHSTRMSSASKALEKGASVDEVMRAGRWRSKAVFDLFYNRSKHLDVAQLILN
jgi:site-specific recombinase XerD